MTTGRLDIVIVNWNAGPLLADCVASLSAARVAGVDFGRIVVVDNASTDASADHLLGAGLPGDGLPLTVLRNADNRGFAAACNQGAAAGSGAFILFLNPDTRLGPPSLAPVLAFMAAPENADVGIAGIRLTDEAGRTQRSCARTPTPGRLLAQSFGLDRLLPQIFRPHFITEWDHEDTRGVDQVMGAFLLIRRDLFDRLAGFDLRYFVYFDDVDLCLRARSAGFRVVHVAAASAIHVGHGTSARIKDRRLFYVLRSRLLFVAKFHGPAAALAVTAATLTVETALRLVQTLARGDLDGTAATLRGIGMLWAALPGLLPRLFGEKP